MEIKKMIAMQYKITFPNDYDMEIVKNRIRLNGSKTDGFEDLLFKAYLYMDTESSKQYAPLYIWNKQDGMNKFIFDGFYDNILASFNWQHINIAVPLEIDIKKELDHTNYVLEIETEIKPSQKMNKPIFTHPDETCLGKVIVYNPDKWKYVEFYFYEAFPEHRKQEGNIYNSLHISR